MALDARQPGWAGTLPALSIFFHDIMGGLEQDTLISTLTIALPITHD